MTNIKSKRIRLMKKKNNVEKAIDNYLNDHIDVFEHSLAKYKPINHGNTFEFGECLSFDEKEIYFIDNIKFHFDKVDKLGTFIEVEAIDKIGDIGIEKLNESCRYYVKYFEIKDDNFIANSYSDLILEIKNK